LTELDDEDIAAQVLAFLVAGLDTTSTLLSFASHQLAVHPELQSRLQEEIDETLQEHGGKFTYEAVHSMKYLGMVVSGESMHSSAKTRRMLNK
jgi:cytochrome P450